MVSNCENQGLAPFSLATISYDHGLWPNAKTTGAYSSALKLRALGIFNPPRASSYELQSGKVPSWHEGINGLYSLSRSMAYDDFEPPGFGEI
jgi:hypothetical protein